MNVHLYFTTGNAAFDDGALHLEAARIFREQAARIEAAGSLKDFHSSVLDINGNRVGNFLATEAEEAPDQVKPYLLASLETGSDAIYDGGVDEVGRILRCAAEKLDEGDLDFGLYDLNGNRVGAVLFEGEEPDADLDNEGGGGGPSIPRAPLLGDSLTALDGSTWILARVELANARNGGQKMEPVFILSNEDESGAFRFHYSEELKANFVGTPSRTFGYVVNLDERGEFYADVRQEDGSTVFEVRNAESEDEGDLVQDGFMSHFRDLSGLSEYLRDTVGVMQPDDSLLSLGAYEKHRDWVAELSDKAAIAWEQHNAAHWYGYVNSLGQSERQFLTSVGAHVGDFDADADRYPVVLDADAKAALDALSGSFTLDVRAITGAERDQPLEAMSDQQLQAFYTSCVVIAAGAAGDDKRDEAQANAAHAQAEIRQRAQPSPPMASPHDSPSP